MTLIQIFILFTSSLFIFIFYNILIPFINLQYYKLKGFNTYFYPILGEIKMWFNSFKTRGDCFADTKDSSKKYPNQKLLITHINNKTLILLRDPQYAKEFFTNPQYYKKDGLTNFIKPLVGNGGIVMSEGDVWKKHRKIISTYFHYGSLRENMSVMQNTTKEFFDKMTADDYKSYAVIPKIQDITGEVFGRIFFGEHLASYKLEGKPLTEVIAQLISDLTFAAFNPISVILCDKALRYPILPRYMKLKKRIAQFRETCFQIVRDRKASKDKGNDLLELLLEAQATKNAEEGLTDKDIVDNFISLFIAGMDTAGHLIGMTLYNLLKNPQYYQALQKERDLLYNIDKQVSADNLRKMDDLHGVLKETLRFYTPAVMPLYRVVVEDHMIGDFLVKKGQWIKPEFMPLFHDEKYFENPEKFYPERWKEGAGKSDPYVFTPFSAGPRNCLGQHLAIAESKIIISEFLERFDYKLKDEKYQLKMIQRFLYEPFEELVFELKPKVQ